MRNCVIHRNSPFRLLAAVLAVLTLTLLAVMVPCEGEAHAAAPIKVACVGDSLTDGSKSSGGKKGDTAYPAWLGRILGSGYDVRNFGAAGDTLLRGTFFRLLCGRRQQFKKRIKARKLAAAGKKQGGKFGFREYFTTFARG